MTAGIIQLAGKGKEDIFLTYNPQITFFKIKYKKHTNFAKEQIQQTFLTQANFNKLVTCNIGKLGDLIGQIFIVVTLPEINIINSDIKFAWINRVGFSLIKSVEIEINNQLIDVHYSEWLNVLCELTGDIIEDHKRGFEKMIGNVNELTDFTKIKNQYTLYIPLYFWFCKNQYLPLVSLEYCNVNINVEFETFEKLYIQTPTHSLKCRDDIVSFTPNEYIEQKINNTIRAGIFVKYDINTKRLYYIKLTNDKLIGLPNISLDIYDTTEKINTYLETPDALKYLIIGQSSQYSSYGDFNEQSITEPIYTIQNANLTQCYLLIDYYYLESEERQKFIDTKHTYLIEQLYYTEAVIDTQTDKLKIDVDNMCKYLIWTTQLVSNINTKDYLNYTNSYNKELNNKNIITEKLTLNSIDVGLINTEIQIYKYINRTISNGIHMYSFSNNIFNFQPSGELNMSLFNNIELHLYLASNINTLNQIIFRCYCTSYNILCIANGL